MSKKVKRLYEQFRPANYGLSLNLKAKTLSFSGSVVITGIKTGRPSQRITFHQKGLNIRKATMVKHGKTGDKPIVIDRINTHKSYDEVRLHTKELLMPGEYSVKLEFKGTITKPMHGIYPCYFKDGEKEKMLLATQFESHHAREAFPCIDEPEAKATFDLTLETQEGETVLSNTPSKSSNVKQGRQTTIFETTPEMSTYLLAFVTGEMQNVERKTKDGVIVRSWATIAQPKSHLEYSANEAVKILEFFTDYFGVPFPLKKCDQVALPDFDAGAMENWGLITYREIALLADPGNRSISSEQYVSLVVAHELSHQWFGNLVTMKWWDDLWLNESFASIMEHVALDSIHPDWYQWEYYTASDVLSTTSRDIYSDIQPVVVEVTDPDLIESLFDPGIVYAKGGRLIKMLREYIGDKAFAAGLKEYFKKHAYGNATRENLWEALAKSSHKDISALMTPWLTQPGMPVVHVLQEGDTISLTQKRFLLDGTQNSLKWPIPLLGNVGIEPELFSSRQATAKLESELPVLLNQYASGHYFVHYADNLHHAALAQELASGNLPAESRINILNDMLLLSRHGDVPLTEALYIVMNCMDEPRDNVWGLMLRAVGSASHITEGDKTCEKNIKAIKILLANDWHQKLGWADHKDDGPNTKQMRHTMISLMVGGEDSSSIKKALSLYKNAKSIENLPAEIRATILGVAVRHGEKSIVGKLLKQYELSSPDEQLDIAVALSSTRDPASAKIILGKALGDKGFVRAQDVLRWLAHFLRNHHTRQVAWDFMVKEWHWIERTMGSSKSFDYLPTYAASFINTEQWAEKYKKFFKPKLDIKALNQNIKIGLSDIESRVAWRKRDELAVKQWLEANAKARSKS